MPPAEKKFVLTHVFKDVLSWKDEENHFSDSEEYFNIPWKLSIKKKEGFLGLYLYCDKNRNGNDDWSVDVDYALKLISVTGRTISEDINYNFTSKEGSGYGFPEFIKWEEMEKNYVVDGKLMIEAHIKINKMTGIEKKKLRNFDESMKAFSDIVLIVNDQKFYVSKLFLGCQSSYFEALFLKNFNEINQSEIVLKDIDPKDFQNFLELLYGESSIDDESIDGILKLTDMYDANLAIRKCESFLINESEKTLKEMLEIAKNYKMENLKKSCLSKINTVEEIQSVMSFDLNESDPSVVAELLRKSVALHNK